MTQRNAAVPKQSPRIYKSPLRAEQVERTREMILETLVRFVADEGRYDSVTLPGLARLAGVSAPTIYRHFPTIDALFGALGDHIASHLGVDALPPELDKLSGYVRALFRSCDAHEALVRTRLLTGEGRAVEKRVGRVRTRGLQRLVTSEVPGLSPVDARALAGVLRVLVSSAAWQALRDDFELTGDEAGRACGWAIRTLVAAARAGGEPLEEKP